MRQNLLFAFVYNALGIPLAAHVLYPFTGRVLSPMIAARAMILSSASVVFNALRSKRIRRGENKQSTALARLPSHYCQKRLAKWRSTLQCPGDCM